MGEENLGSFREACAEGLGFPGLLIPFVPRLLATAAARVDVAVATTSTVARTVEEAVLLAGTERVRGQVSRNHGL